MQPATPAIDAQTDTTPHAAGAVIVTAAKPEGSITGESPIGYPNKGQGAVSTRAWQRRGAGAARPWVFRIGEGPLDIIGSR